MTPRKMLSKFGGRCRSCRNSISVGQTIYWEKGLTLCEDCGSSGGGTEPINAPTIPAAPKFDASGKYSTDWAEFRAILKDALNGNLSRFRDPEARREFQELARHTRSDDFYGYSAEEFGRWVRNGYSPEALKGLAEFIPPVRDKRRLQFNEEDGELLLDVAWSGGDNYFSEWTKRQTIPGLSIIIRQGVRAGTPAAVLNQFNIWVARTIYSLEASGVDCAVTLLNRNRGCFRTGPKETEHRLVLKKENEKTDFLSISTALSPAQHRTVMFALRALHCNDAGYKFHFNQGRSVNERNEWKIEYDAAKGELLINCPHMPHEFPETRMTSELREILKTVRG